MQDNQNPKKLVEPRTLKGFRDILPKEAIVKNQMIAALSSAFETFGFVPIQTPHLEYTECLFGDAGSEIQKQVYRFQDNGKRDVALRFDLTVPFARFISQHKNTIGLPFKRWAVGEVFRGENTQAGRYREFTQCDFDIVGTESISADAEIIQVITSAMRILKIDRFQIRINNRKVMNGLAAALGVADKVGALLIEIDKIDKVGKEAVCAALVQNVGMSDVAVKELMEFVEISSGNNNSTSILKASHSYRSKHPLLEQGLSELESIIQILNEVGIADPLVRIDLSIARGLGYYTGIIYETTLLDCPKIGSICSGGRYDNLTQTFQKERCPGVGASVGLDRLLAALEAMNLLPTTSTPAKVLITVPETSKISDSVKVAAMIRDSGVSTEVYPDAHKMKRQIDYAKRAGHPFIVVFTSSNNEMILEELSTGERHSCVNVSEIISKLTVS